MLCPLADVIAIIILTIGGLGLMLLPLMIMAVVIAKWQMEWPQGELCCL